MQQPERPSSGQQPAAASGTVVSPFVPLAEALSVEQSRPGSGSNARLAALANDLLSERPDVLDVLQAHGFRLGTHANQFDHELSAAEMEAIRLELVQASNADRLSSVPRGHGDPQPEARRRTSNRSASLRLGKWWKKYGYRGPSYCQRCSELFRDHIIRSLSNSAQCTLETPCLDCRRILVHFPDGVKR